MEAVLYITRGPPAGKDVQMTDAHGGGSGAGNSAYYPSAQNARDEYGHLPPLQKMVMEAIVSNRGATEGVHVSAITRSLAGKYGAEEIRYVFASLSVWFLIRYPLATPLTNSRRPAPYTVLSMKAITT